MWNIKTIKPLLLLWIIFTGSIFFAISPVHAQSLTYQQVDALTYDYYMEGNWGELIKTGEKAKKDGYDFFYLNLRIGVAYFNLKDYYKAEKYLRKAHKQDSSNEIVNDFLHWTLINLGQTFQAEEFKPIANGAVKRKSGQRIESVFTEAGMKLSSNPDSSANLKYFNIGVQHRICSDLSLYYAFTHLDQRKNIWGGYGQEQVYVAGTLNLHRGWVVTLANHVAFFSSTMTYLTDSTTAFIPPPPQPPFPGADVYDTSITHTVRTVGQYGQTSDLVSINVAKTIGRWTFIPSCNFYYEMNSPEYKVVNRNHDVIRTLNKGQVVKSTSVEDFVNDSVVSNNSTTWEANPGFGITFVPPVLHNRFVLSGKIILPVGQAGPGLPILTPELKFFAGKRHMFNVSYFYKGPEVVADKSGSVLYNCHDIIHSLYSFSYMFQVSHKTALYGTYQYEDLTGFFLSSRYQLNSFIISLKLNL